MATQTLNYHSVRHQKESYSTPASHPAVQQFSSTKSVPVLVSQVQRNRVIIGLTNYTLHIDVVFLLFVTGACIHNKFNLI
ncbi:hypothetical protein MTP99_002944 [Tenebrio molitor]|nr:hypothetical protein MTP99_002944 [Tenebrio molitor]